MNQELFDYFTTDNISGKKCTEVWLKKNNEELHKKIIEWSNTIEILNCVEFKRKVYHFIHNLTEIPTCKTCKGEVNYKRIREGYSDYCSDKCIKDSEEYKLKWKQSWKKNNMNGSFLEKRKKTAILKYGDLETYKRVTEKNRKKKIVEKYGVDSIFQLESFKETRKNTLKEKYGNDNFNNPEKTRRTRIDNGTQINDELVTNFRQYKKVVINRTFTIYNNNKELVNPTNLIRGKKQYHIDHMYSIKQGFLNNIPIEIITHPYNLHMIHYKDNLVKQDSCWIEIDELLKKISESNLDIEVNHAILKDKYRSINETARQLLEKFNLLQ